MKTTDLKIYHLQNQVINCKLVLSIPAGNLFKLYKIQQPVRVLIAIIRDKCWLYNTFYTLAYLNECFDCLYSCFGVSFSTHSKDRYRAQENRRIITDKLFNVLKLFSKRFNLLAFIYIHLAFVAAKKLSRSYADVCFYKIITFDLL